MLPTPPVMLITDAAQALLPLDEIIEQSCRAGCRWILLRDLNADDDILAAQAIRIKILCKAFNTKLYISRNMNVAKAIHADGIHLSASQCIDDARHICSDMMIGRSCHSIADVLEAEQNGADYVTLSPIFETTSKPGYGPALGLAALKQTRAQTNLPILALGGIDYNQALPCVQRGASGVAVMGSIMRSSAPQQAMLKLLQSLVA